MFRLVRVACGLAGAASPAELEALRLKEHLRDELCPMLADENRLAKTVQERRGYPRALKDHVAGFLAEREWFDSTLTGLGVLQAANLNEKTRGLQEAWLGEHEAPSAPGQRRQTYLLSSNNIRAVDTLLNGMQALGAGVPVVLHTALQELNANGNGDTVSMFLPLGLSGTAGELASNGPWVELARRRRRGYREAAGERPGVARAPWAPGGDLADMGWWRARNLSFARCGSPQLFAGGLVNHCYYLPTRHILKYPNLREPPPGPLETVRLPHEYDPELNKLTRDCPVVKRAIEDYGNDRVRYFLSWLHRLHASHDGLKRVVVVAHSSWFVKFAAYVQARGGLSHGSCAGIGASRLRNTAVLKVADGECSCLFDGAELGGACNMK